MTREQVLDRLMRAIWQAVAMDPEVGAALDDFEAVGLAPYLALRAEVKPADAQPATKPNDAAFLRSIRIDPDLEVR